MLNRDKQFHYYIVCDGVLASIAYKVQKNGEQQQESDEPLRQR